MAAINLALAFLVALARGFHELTGAIFGFAFFGGLVWATSAFCVFAATERLGMACPYGI